MKKIAISGNIASGKTTVQKIIEAKGYKVLDTDDVSRDLLTIKNIPLYEAFKDYDVFEDNEFSRYKVGQLIFSNKEAIKTIADVMHPQIKDVMIKFFEDNNEDELLFVGIPLLFEANMQNLFDKIIFIYTDDNLRLERLIKRNSYTVEHAENRMLSQKSQDEKVKLSDYVITNNGTEEELEEQITKLLEQIRLS